MTPCSSGPVDSAQRFDMRPLVSICIPCHNQAEFVGECIESALRQTYPNVEVIVIDDGSTDHSLEVIRRFGSRIRWETGPNRGAPVARNRALALSSGAFVNFLDADDLLEPEKVERQLPILLSGAADIVLAQGWFFGEGIPARPKSPALPSPAGVDPFLYVMRCNLSTCGPLHRREAIVRVNGFRPDLRRGQETELHLRMTAAGARLALAEGYLFRSRHHTGSRLTSLILPPQYWLGAMLDLADWIETQYPQTFDSARRHALASRLFQHAIYAYRNGGTACARQAFARARRLSPTYDYQERGWYQALEPVVGPLALERTLAVARRARDLGQALLRRATHA